MTRLLFLIVLLLPLHACKPELIESDIGLESFNQLVIEKVNGDTHAFDIETVTTIEDMAKGLMHRTEMAEDAGMLFYFGGQEVERRFWMKNTLIPLDMIFIKRDGTIHHIHENAVPHDLTLIPSRGPVAAVLEINGGLSAKLGFKVGDKVKHTVFTAK